MKILVFGGGAIGCHISYCMYECGNSVTLIGRGEHLLEIKKDGMKIQVYDNEILKNEVLIHEDDRFEALDSIDKIKHLEFDCIFITVKLADYNERVLNVLKPYVGENTAIIPSCTKMPFWWFYDLKGKYDDIEFDNEIATLFDRRNIIMMTMWLSAVIEKPGLVLIKHTQRGYPLESLYSKMDNYAEKLRDIFNRTCKSPTVGNIRDEIYTKSINSLAFNVVALDKEFNNLQLSKDKQSKESIKKIMLEGEEILRKLNIPISQNIDERINQTLSSTKHTMSMLHDYRIGKDIELSYIWDSFEKISKIMEIEMSFTKKIVEKVLLKVSSNTI